MHISKSEILLCTGLTDYESVGLPCPAANPAGTERNFDVADVASSWKFRSVHAGD